MVVPPALYTTKLEKPMVDVLAAQLLADLGEQPEQFHQALILLPNRRSCVALREAFLRYAPQTVLVLPRIQPIGDMEEEALWIGAYVGSGEALSMLEAIPQAMPESMRLLRATQMVQRFLNKQKLGAGVEQASQLAASLMSVFDTLERQRIPAEKLLEMDSSMASEHWQIVHDFLAEAVHAWRQMQEKTGMISATARRNRVLEVAAKLWEASPPHHPIIAAGSTASIPATAELLRVIANLPQGKVVLPGVDTYAPEDQWQAVEPTHPQFHLKQLLGALGVPNREMRYMDADAVKGGSAARARMWLEALRPASFTDSWADAQVDIKAAIENLSYFECAEPEEEAKTIALLLREALETPHKTAALVTPDYTLMRRVSCALHVLGVEVDLWAGHSLAESQHGQLLLLLAQVGVSKAAPNDLLALLKHPLCQMGDDAHAWQEFIRELETYSLRGIRPSAGMGNLRSDKFSPTTRDLLRQVMAACEPFFSLFSRRKASLAELLQTHRNCFEALMSASVSDDISESLWHFLDGLEAHAKQLEALEVQEYPALLRLLLSQQRASRATESHPRIAIVPPAEARLQHYDRVILGGMNEDVWPSSNSPDPWLSAAMRRKLGLPDASEHIGQQAHDVVMLASLPEVFITRSQKVDGVVMLPSRWLERLEAFTQIKGVALTEWKKTSPWHAWLKQAAQVEAKPIAPPKPKPPAEARPRSWSPTGVELLMRDPYGAYARYVLDLRALDTLDKEPDQALFGTMIHKIMEKLHKRLKAGEVALTLEHIMRIGHEVFAEHSARPSVQNLWWPRFEAIAQWILKQEETRATERVSVQPEEEVKVNLTLSDGTAATLAGRIDRLETLPDGAVRVADYKTGDPPDKKEVESGFSPQLLLCALMLDNAAPLDRLEYWRISGRADDCDITTPLKATREELAETLADTREQVVRVLAHYLDAASVYPSAPIAAARPKYPDYDHLARRAEWE